LAPVIVPLSGTVRVSVVPAGNAVVAPLTESFPIVIPAPFVMVMVRKPFAVLPAEGTRSGSKLKLFVMVTLSELPAASVAVVTPVGKLAAALPPPEKAGLGATVPTGTAQAGQSCPSVRVTVCVAGVGENVKVLPDTETPVGRNVLTEIVVLFAGTFQTVV
jgi:hypothetical protein